MYLPALNLLARENVVYLMYDSVATVNLIRELSPNSNFRFIYKRDLKQLIFLRINYVIGFNSSTFKVILLSVFLRCVRFINILPYTAKSFWPFVFANNKKIHKSQLFFEAISHYFLTDIPSKENSKNDCKPSAPKKVLLVPGSAAVESHKRWPADHFINLASLLSESIQTIDVIAGPEEVDLGRLIHKSITCADINSSFHSTQSISDLVQIVMEYDLVIANDTFVSHLANYLGVPALSIFGPTDPSITGAGHLFVRSSVPCSPCYSRKNVYGCTTPICMRSVSPLYVFNLIRSNFKL